MLTDNNKIFHRKKILTIFLVCTGIFSGLLGRLVYLCVWEAEHYSAMADQLHERERSIKAARGRILDRNGTVLADNRTVCTISVIHNQLEDPEEVIEILTKELELSEDYVRKRVEKYSAMERIKSNVDKELGDRIREYDLAGVKVDEDYKRYYPYDDLASKVLGFTGGDNQGIIGLEVVYDEYLQGEPGEILTVTDAKGIEVEAAGERRREPVSGSLHQPGQEHPVLRHPACGTGPCHQGGGQRVRPGDESAERGDLRLRECAGIRFEQSLRAAGGDAGRHQPGGIPEHIERHLAERLHQRYIRTGIHLQDRHRGGGP